VSKNSSRKIASQIIVQIFKVLLPSSSTRVEGLADLANTFGSLQGSNRSPETLRVQLEGATDELEQILRVLENNELGKLPQGEKDIVIEGACKALEKMNINHSDVIRRNMNEEDLAEILIPVATKHWKRSASSESAMRYGREYVRQASRYLITAVKDMPQYTPELIAQNYSLTQKIYSDLQQSFDSVILPSHRRGITQEIAAFESGYRSDIISNCKNMHLFGLDVSTELRRQPIDVAYITLQATYTTKPFKPFPQKTVPHAAQKSLSRTTAQVKREGGVDEILGKMAERFHGSAKGGRILLSGNAGSGKTTVIQWLAMNAARRSFPGNLSPWNSCIPFVIQLRNVFKGQRYYGPTEDDLVLPASHRHRQRPGDWVEKTLKSGNALVLFDGLDELSEIHRATAYKWIDALMRDNPKISVLVTSRPEGIDKPWFDQFEFVHHALQPMKLPEIHLCLDAWFSAIASISPEEKVQKYREMRSRLIMDLERGSAVRELAETPLLCAMLCALYAFNLTESAPGSRSELYKRVTDALIHDREQVRKGPTGDLNLREKAYLLQSLARHMIDANQATITVHHSHGHRGKTATFDKPMTAMEIVEKQLSSMPTVPHSARTVLNFLLERSVVFYHVPPSEAQFAHRSIQEYLAACDYANSESVDLLVSKAHEPQWRRIIVYAAGEFMQSQASTLIDGLLRATESTEDTRSLLLLIAECLDSAIRIDAPVAHRATQKLSELFPPRTMDEADLIGRANHDVLGLLNGHEDKGSAIIAACVRAAVVSGLPDGLDVVERYSSCTTDPTIAEEVVKGWVRFDAEEYAERVLTNLPLEDMTLTINHTDCFSSTRVLRNLRKARVRIKAPIYGFNEWSPLQKLQRLDLGGCTGLRELTGLANLGSLRSLSLARCSNVYDISELSGIPKLRELDLTKCSAVRNFSSLSRLSEIRVLFLDHTRSAEDFYWLADMNSLWTLSLNGCQISYVEFLENLQNMRTLRLDTSTGVIDTGPLRACSSLRRLELRIASRNNSALQLPASSNISTLHLRGNISVSDVESAFADHPIVDFSASSINGLPDFRFLSSAPKLELLTINDCADLEYIDIPEHEKIESMEIGGRWVRRVVFKKKMPRLHSLTLENCQELSEISDVVEAIRRDRLPSLRHLSLPRRLMEEQADEIREISPSIIINHDPFAPVGFASS
jgi:hypothetical protein